MKKLLALFLGLALITACSKEKEEGGEDDGIAKKTNLLPDASGEYGEVVIVMNKDKWNAELGAALKEVFHEDVPGLTRAEPYFTTRVIEPFQFNKIFKVAKNLVYVTSFQGNAPADKWLKKTFSESAQAKIMADEASFMNTGDNQYSKGQKVLQLYGKDDATLIKNLKANKEIIRNYFNIAERQRLAKELKMSTATRGVVTRLRNEHGYTIKIPGNFELAMMEEDFMWARHLPAVGPSKNLFVYFKQYESQEEFEHANVIKLRNEIGKKYIFGDPKNEESYMTTEEKYVPIAFRNISFADRYTVETKGAWKTNNLSVGGSLVSYTFVDEPTKRLYYVEGFVIHPNEEHRELIREMESLLTTFRSAAP